MPTLSAVDFTAPDAAREFATSLRETGFGVLKNHPIDKALVSRIYETWENWFKTGDKTGFDFSRDTQDGFFPASISEKAQGYDVKDIKEYFHFYPWGRIPEELRADVEAYYAGATKLAATLLSWVEANTPADIAKNYRVPLSSMIADSQKTLLRILHYPPMTGSEEPGAVRAAAHTDINLLTILPAANEPGLQVQAKDGSWIDVPCEFGTLVVNIGDMLQEASGHYYPSTKHRVINPTGERSEKSRISMPLFLHPRPDVVLSDRYTADSYLKERLRELGVL
ncbi:isopenicillin N synthase family dioxygenase [Pseudokordiimonas caeni]|uniref:isopenicillin N synthase family dioxygenase n=1 Tax=Pseudokordiimonas caeni TaxID=2997908 RepID=UPI002810AD13|nr:2OG-Fe(II) oxygenase family protein [Pseudokordiimonas caeni]